MYIIQCTYALGYDKMEPPRPEIDVIGFKDTFIKFFFFFFSTISSILGFNVGKKG
jgi:hypothetical protein